MKTEQARTALHVGRLFYIHREKKRSFWTSLLTAKLKSYVMKFWDCSIVDMKKSLVKLWFTIAHFITHNSKYLDEKLNTQELKNNIFTIRNEIYGKE